MNLSRRDLSLLLPALAAATVNGQPANLPSRVFGFDELPVRGNSDSRSRAVLDGLTHSGFHIEMHETELAPGMAPHPPHHHEYEEMIMIREGSLAVTIDGKVNNVGPGGVVYVASNQEHGWRNIGDTRAHYFVLALGRPGK